MLGLVLTAGGARGAYQAGVLKRVGEIPALRDEPSPFAIVTGASAGAINGAAVAGGSGSFHEVTQQLAALWSALRVEDVFRTDLLSLGWGAAGLLRDMALGGLLGHTVTQALFDTSPLRVFLRRQAAAGRHRGRASAQGHLYAVAVSATSYHSGRSFTFVQGRDGPPGVVASRGASSCRSRSRSTTCWRRPRSRWSSRRSACARRRATSTSATARCGW